MHAQIGALKRHRAWQYGHVQPQHGGQTQDAASSGGNFGPGCKTTKHTPLFRPFAPAAQGTELGFRTDMCLAPLCGKAYLLTTLLEPGSSIVVSLVDTFRAGDALAIIR